MARLVVLSFDDNDDAEAFIKEHDNLYYYPPGAMGGISNDQEAIYAGEVVALYAMPTMFCPGFGGCGTGRVKGWTRGKKFGWWVCVTCHKPSGAGGTEKTIRAVCSQGVNLLRDVDDQEVETGNEEGWGVNKSAL